MSDSDIEKLEKLEPEVAEDFIDENYSSIYGKYHEQFDTVFSMDKGWDITKYLLKKADFSTNKILKELDKKYIKSDLVKRINHILNEITIERLMELYEPNELIEQNVYRGEVDKNKKYIAYHFDLYKAGFKKAAELNDGIVINYN